MVALVESVDIFESADYLGGADKVHMCREQGSVVPAKLAEETVSSVDKVYPIHFQSHMPARHKLIIVKRADRSHLIVHDSFAAPELLQVVREVEVDVHSYREQSICVDRDVYTDELRL